MFFLIYIVSVIFYFIYLGKVLADFPRVDDFSTILKTVVLWVEDNSASNFFRLLHLQHNEHRIALVRLFSIVFYGIEGHINFRHLAFAGNVFWVLTPLIFLISSKKPRYIYLAVLPLFFNVKLYGSSLWTMASLSNFPLLFLLA